MTEQPNISVLLIHDQHHQVHVRTNDHLFGRVAYVLSSAKLDYGCNLVPHDGGFLITNLWIYDTSPTSDITAEELAHLLVEAGIRVLECEEFPDSVFEGPATKYAVCGLPSHENSTVFAITRNDTDDACWFLAEPRTLKLVINTLRDAGLDFGTVAAAADGRLSVWADSDQVMHAGVIGSLRFSGLTVIDSIFLGDNTTGWDD